MAVTMSAVNNSLNCSLTSLHWLQKLGCRTSGLARPLASAVTQRKVVQQIFPTQKERLAAEKKRKQAAKAAANKVAAALKAANGGAASKNGKSAASKVNWNTNSKDKPPHCYATLIYMAMRSLRKEKVTLGEIYTFVKSNFLYYRTHDNGWKNSIRHNLTQHACFVKVQRTDEHPGKGGYWQLSPDYEIMFQNGIFKRKRRKIGSQSGANSIRQTGSSAGKSQHASATSGKPGRRKAIKLKVPGVAIPFKWPVGLEVVPEGLDVVPDDVDDGAASYADDGAASYADDGAASYADDGAASYADDGAASYADDGAASYADDGAASYADDGAASYADDGAASYADDGAASSLMSSPIPEEIEHLEGYDWANMMPEIPAIKQEPGTEPAGCRGRSGLGDHFGGSGGDGSAMLHALTLMDGNSSTGSPISILPDINQNDGSMTPEGPSYTFNELHDEIDYGLKPQPLSLQQQIKHVESTLDLSGNIGEIAKMDTMAWNGQDLTIKGIGLSLVEGVVPCVENSKMLQTYNHITPDDLHDLDLAPMPTDWII